MQLVRHIDWRGNFGDDLNVPFFKELFPNYDEKLQDYKLYGIGTLLNNVHGQIRNSVVFGSGFGYGDTIDIDSSSCKIFGVRGPITAKKLNLQSDLIIGDPAFYVEKMPSFGGGIDRAGGAKTVIALNHRSCELWDFRSLNSESKFFLDPGDESIPDYLATIRNANLVIAESLHAAIIASMYGVPYIPLSIRAPVDATKWADFGASLNIEFGNIKKIRAPDISFARRVRVSRVREKIDAVFGASRYGTRLAASANAKDFLSDLARVEVESDRIAASRSSVNNLQLKIEGAIGLMKDFLAQSSK